MSSYDILRKESARIYSSIQMQEYKKIALFFTGLVVFTIGTTMTGYKREENVEKYEIPFFLLLTATIVIAAIAFHQLRCVRKTL